MYPLHSTQRFLMDATLNPNPNPNLNPIPRPRRKIHLTIQPTEIKMFSMIQPHAHNRPPY